MASEYRVVIEGLRPFQRKMLKASGGLKEMTKAAREAGRIVTTRAVHAAPVLTGRLAMSLRFTAGPLRTEIRGGSARVPYAGPIHWGWAKRNIHANPFISASAQATESVWVEAYRKEAQAILDRVSRGTP